MTELHITEYQGIGQDCMGNQVQVAHGERGRQTLRISETPSVSAAVNGHYVRLFPAAPCRVTFGPDPTPDSLGIPLAAEVAEYFHVSLGFKVLVMARS